MRVTESSLSYWSNVNDAQDRPTLTVKVETETGQPVRLVLADRETLEPLFVASVDIIGCSGIGQALMLASTMKTEEMREMMRGEE